MNRETITAKSRAELVSICKTNNIKGYSGKAKQI